VDPCDSHRTGGELQGTRIGHDLDLHPPPKRREHVVAHAVGRTERRIGARTFFGTCYGVRVAMFSRWLLAFAVTQAIEIPIYLWATPGRPWARRLWIAAMASAMTHPIVWAMGWVIRPYLLYVLVAEMFAVVVEALWLRYHGVPQPLWWALTANATSVAVFIGGQSLVRALTSG
jgi:hypothetical protein